MKIDKVGKDILPTPPKFSKMVGPSFIMLGMGLGSGELIMWPYMAANYGLGIIWAAVIGITFQFFINMEIKTEYHGDLPEHEKYADLRSMYR